jgi:hypothetical protein
MAGDVPKTGCVLDEDQSDSSNVDYSKPSNKMDGRQTKVQSADTDKKEVDEIKEGEKKETESKAQVGGNKKDETKPVDQTNLNDENRKIERMDIVSNPEVLEQVSYDGFASSAKTVETSAKTVEPSFTESNDSNNRLDSSLPHKSENDGYFEQNSLHEPSSMGSFVVLDSPSLDYEDSSKGTRVSGSSDGSSESIELLDNPQSEVSSLQSDFASLDISSGSPTVNKEEKHGNIQPTDDIIDKSQTRSEKYEMSTEGNNGQSPESFAAGSMVHKHLDGAEGTSKDVSANMKEMPSTDDISVNSGTDTLYRKSVNYLL